MLSPGDARDTLPGKLRDLPGCDLANAGSPALTEMAGLYEAVKQALSADTVKNPNARVAASKLCVRKGPDLFPVRDTEVCDYPGPTRWRNYQVDWQVFRSLTGDRHHRTFPRRRLVKFCTRRLRGNVRDSAAESMAASPMSQSAA
jgi:hypothetical protein